MTRLGKEGSNLSRSKIDIVSVLSLEDTEMPLVDCANKYIAEKRNQVITDYEPGDEVYVDIRVCSVTFGMRLCHFQIYTS